MEHVAVRDQANEEHCYAETAAQMADAWRFTHGDRNYAHQTSGYALALGANLDFFGTGVERPSESVASGDVCNAVINARNEGSCDRRAVLEQVGGSSVDQTVALLRRYYDEYQEWRNSRSRARAGIEASIHGGLTPGQEIACRLEGDLVARHVASELRPSYHAILRLLDGDNPLTYLRGMMMQACQAPHVISLSRLPFCMNLPMLSASMAHGAVASRLQASRQPVAITYCSSILTRGRAPSPGSSAVLSASVRQFTSDCGNHVSLVIGQRRNPTTRRCQFLIRNSWGTACTTVDSSTRRQVSRYSADWQCEGGNIWVDADVLVQNVFAVGSLSR